MSLRVVMFGKTGQMARCVQAQAAGAGVMVEALSREHADLRDADAVRAVLDARAFDAVLNAAAYNAVDKAEDEPDVALAVNARAPQVMAQACAARGAAFLTVSTDYVFDGASEEPYAEDAPTNPLSAYGRSKREGEGRVLEAHPGAVVVRTAWVHSRFPGNFASWVAERARAGQPQKGATDQISSPTFAGDLAAGALALLKRAAAGEASGIVHLAGRGTATRHAFMQAVVDVVSPGTAVAPGRAADFPSAAARPAFSALDSDLAGRVHGVVMASWQDGVRRAFASSAAEAAS